MAQQPYQPVAAAHRHAGVYAWWTALEQAARRLAVITAAGALLGLLVGGVGGRLAMLLLAFLNPSASGLVSDDGFVMGQFTVAGSANLLLAGLLLGIVGAGCYAALRGLMIGPCWFQVLSVSVGPAVVVAALLVHVEGVDFTLLQPAWLGIALFVAIPLLYAALLTVLVERWLEPGSRLAQAPRLVVVVLLLLWTPVAPLLGVLLLGWIALELLRRHAVTDAFLRQSSTAWAARAGLAVLFGFAVVDLVADVRVLV